MRNRMANKKNTKRLMGALASLLMVYTLIPASSLSAYAEGTARYQTLEIAEDSLNGNTVYGVGETNSTVAGLDDVHAGFFVTGYDSLSEGGMPSDGV